MLNQSIYLALGSSNVILPTCNRFQDAVIRQNADVLNGRAVQHASDKDTGAVGDSQSPVAQGSVPNRYVGTGALDNFIFFNLERKRHVVVSRTYLLYGYLGKVLWVGMVGDTDNPPVCESDDNYD